MFGVKIMRFEVREYIHLDLKLIFIRNPRWLTYMSPNILGGYVSI